MRGTSRRRVRCRDGHLQGNSTRPAGITNASGQPEIVLEIDGLTISMTPPGPSAAPVPNDASERDPEDMTAPTPDEPHVPGADLARFVDAQRGTFEQALGEIEAGRKRSHWMWYIFPQVSGLGASAISARYAVGSVKEAEAFLSTGACAPLSPNRRRCGHQVASEAQPFVRSSARPTTPSFLSLR